MAESGARASTLRDSSTADGRVNAVVLSAQWAAWADALGWISELTDEAGLQRRTKGRPLQETMPWLRRIGGRSGVQVLLPAGTYSDDTQLRLAVCRSYGPAGFDPETFSAVELTVFPSYAFGAGNGTKSAAANMTRSTSRWSNNRPPDYASLGGNGAAMRAQPHAWFLERPLPELVADAVRDAVITHGHPSGILGAVLVALATADCLQPGGGRLRRGGPEVWPALLDQGVALLNHTMEIDAELREYWMPNWDLDGGQEWQPSLRHFLEEAFGAVAVAQKVVYASSAFDDGYSTLLDVLGMRERARRGSGFHTTLVAFAAMALGQKHDMHEIALIRSVVRALGSDTDTIATILGGLLGPFAGGAPPGELLDRDYISASAARLADPMALAKHRHAYPDLVHWTPPRTQADALYRENKGLVVAGLGKVLPLSEPIAGPSSGSAWSWVELPWHQTLMIKHRLPVPERVPDTQVAKRQAPSAPTLASAQYKRERLASGAPGAARPESKSVRPTTGLSPLLDALDRLASAPSFSRAFGSEFEKLLQDHGAGVATAFASLAAERYQIIRASHDSSKLW